MQRLLITTLLLLTILWPGMGFSAQVGEKAPEFFMNSLDGAKVGSSVNENPLLIIFWATWCQNCKREIPTLEKIYQEFKSKDLDVLAVNAGVNDSIERTKKFMKKYNISYPVAFDDESLVTKKFGVQGVPTIIIIDKTGVIRYQANSVPDDFGGNFEKLLNISD